MNRFMLIQLCYEHDLQIANTFSSKSENELITYREIWHRAGDSINRSNHEMLDLFSLPRTEHHRISGIQIIRDFTLRSHHYLLTADLDVQLGTIRERLRLGNFSR